MSTLLYADANQRMNVSRTCWQWSGETLFSETCLINLLFGVGKAARLDIKLWFIPSAATTGAAYRLPLLLKGDVHESRPAWQSSHVGLEKLAPLHERIFMDDDESRISRYCQRHFYNR